jgi:hypothetical protein
MTEAIDIQETDLLLKMLPSYLDTADTQAFYHRLYLGTQVDATVDAALQSDEFKAYVEAQWNKYRVPIEIYRQPLSPGLVDLGAKVNFLALKAHNDGCDYLAFGLSDLVFKTTTPGWDHLFVNAVKRHQNWGWAGETAYQSGWHVSYLNFVSRQHIDLFGYFVPPVLKNWFMDDWLRDVYKDTKLSDKVDASIKHDHAIRKHIGDTGSRYYICRNHRPVFKQQIGEAQATIVDALQPLGLLTCRGKKSCQWRL